MPRKPKPKNTLSAGERAAIYEAEQAEKRARMQEENIDASGRGTAPMAKAEKLEKQEKPKVVLPKPQHATVRVDFSMPVGKIKAMHGMCNGPVSYGSDLSSLFREIGVPHVRFDGTDTALSAYAVDVSRIFKDPGRDPRDESAYDFSYTDRYVAAAYNAGAKVIFRLGESIDRMHSGKEIVYPKDIDVFVEVCANIVRHYNDYWANGYAYGIEHFEIWCLDGRGDTEKAFEIYRRVASALKLIDSGIKVGGMGFDGADSAFREFVRYCARRRAPIDFVTVSDFSGDPKDASDRIRNMIPILHNLGFADAEIMIGAWNYVDAEAIGTLSLEKVLSSSDERFKEARRKVFEEQSSVKGAAYALAFMISLGSVREVTRACFFDAQPYLSAWCSISDRFGNPQKPFYAFKAYGEIFKAGKEVYSVTEELEGYAHSGIYSIAAEGNGALYVLISSFDGCGIVDLRLDAIPENIYTADVYMLDGVKDMTLADSIPISGAKKRLLLNISKYGAAMVRLY